MHRYWDGKTPFEGDYIDDFELCNEVKQLLENEQVFNENKESSTPSEVEIKTLPSSLKYTFLGANPRYPIIVNNELNGNDLDCLVNLVRTH